MSIYDLQLEQASGQRLDLSIYRGQVLLIVNTASRCAFARQLAALSGLHNRYHTDGFSVIAVPCDQFAQQEPLDNPQLVSFFKETVGAQFPVLSKQAVEGEHQSPLYRWLEYHDPRRFKAAPFIPWNFTKLLVDSQGKLVKRLAPVRSMSSVEGRIQKLLG